MGGIITKDTTFYRYGTHGYIELIDARTGAVLAVHESMEAPPPAEFTQHTLENGDKVLVQTSLDLAKLNLSRQIKFSQAMADLIADLVIGGTPLSKVPNVKGMPSYTTISRWRREDPDFNAQIKFARQMRAERLRDEALAAAEEAVGQVSEYVAGHKLKVDTLKWAAEKDSPMEYGTKVEVSGQIGHVHLVIETGIRRPGDAAPVKPVEVVNEG